MATVIDTTRSASHPVRSVSKEGGLNESFLQAAVLGNLSSQLSQMLGSSTEKSAMETTSDDDSYDEADMVSLRTALADMMISLEMYKVNVADAQNSRTNSSMNIDKAIQAESLNAYEEMLKNIAKMAEMKKKKGIFGVFGKAGGWVMQIGMVMLVGIVCGPAAGVMAATLLLANEVPLKGDKSGMDFINKGLATAIMACGCKNENIANIIAGAISAVVVGVASGKITNFGMGVQQFLAQMQANQVGAQIVDSTVTNEDKKQAWLIGLSVTNVLLQVGFGAYGARAAGASLINAHKVQQVSSILTAAGAISMGIGAIGTGVMQFKTSELLEKHAEVMEQYSLTGNILEANGDTREEMDDHTQNLLQTEFDYSAYSQPGKELAKALNR